MAFDEYRYIDYEVTDGVGTITLARPDKANSQNERFLDELDERFTAAEYDDDVVVIAGKGHERGQEVAGVVTPFDDRDVAREVLAGRAEGW